MAHAYFVAGENEQAIEAATAFAEQKLGREKIHTHDLVVLRYELFSVEEGRKLMSIACAAPVIGDQKVIIISAKRFFHEAQNALLKLFEEPPQGVVLILVIPSAGVLLPTLRSRLTELPVASALVPQYSETVRLFLKADAAERQNILEKLIARSKSDKDDEKQQARSEAVRLAEDFVRASQSARETTKDTHNIHELRLFEYDLLRFIPLLNTRSAPLKLIFEHLLLVIPKNIAVARV